MIGLNDDDLDGSIDSFGLTEGSEDNKAKQDGQAKETLKKSTIEDELASDDQEDENIEEIKKQIAQFNASKISKGNQSLVEKANPSSSSGIVSNQNQANPIESETAPDEDYSAVPRPQVGPARPTTGGKSLMNIFKLLKPQAIMSKDFRQESRKEIINRMNQCSEKITEFLESQKDLITFDM